MWTRLNFTSDFLGHTKTKGKSSWVIPKVVAVDYGSARSREHFIAKFKSQFKQGFTKVDVTTAGR